MFEDLNLVEEVIEGLELSFERALKRENQGMTLVPNWYVIFVLFMRVCGLMSGYCCWG